MLVVSGIIRLDPAQHDAALAAMLTLTEATLAEDGNITYGFWPHATERGLFRVYEEWESKEAMDLHMGSAHMAEFLGAAGGFGITETNIVVHESASSTRLM